MKKINCLIAFIAFAVLAFAVLGLSILIIGNSNNILVRDSEIQGLTAEQIDTLVIERWLNQYKTPSKPLSQRINDFKIEKIYTTENPYSFSVMYTVYPASMQSTDWIAGNGETTDNAVKNKYEFVTLEHVGDGLVIKNMGTGP